MYIVSAKVSLFKRKVKLEDLVLDLTRNCTYIQKCTLNATFLFASADGCIKTKNKENVTARLNTEIIFH